jgi:hypothetical protein
MDRPNKFGEPSSREHYSRNKWLDDVEVETSRNVVDFGQRTQQLLQGKSLIVY